MLISYLIDLYTKETRHNSGRYSFFFFFGGIAIKKAYFSFPLLFFSSCPPYKNIYTCSVQRPQQPTSNTSQKHYFLRLLFMNIPLKSLEFEITSKPCCYFALKLYIIIYQFYHLLHFSGIKLQCFVKFLLFIIDDELWLINLKTNNFDIVGISNFYSFTLSL